MSFLPSTETVSRVRRWLPLLAVFALAILILGSWRQFAAFDWNAFGAVYGSVHWGWMSVSAGLVLGTYLARVLRWRMMIRPLAPEASSLRIFKATAIGFTAVILLGRPGELVRPWLISKAESVPFSSQMATWFLERVFDLLAVLALFGLGLYAFDPAGRDVTPGIAWILNVGGGLVAVMAVACLVILFFAGKSKEVVTARLSDALAFLPEPWLSRTQGLAASFTSGMACCRKTSDVIGLLGITVIEWTVIVGGTICFFRAFPATAHMSNLDTVVYLGFVAFGSIVQIPGIGGGVQIAGTVVLSQLFGLSAAEAAGIAVANWLVTWVSILPIGVALAASEGLRWQSLRRISQDLQSQESQP
ncbi:MAG: lysylphosphatidylglycerol synthase transmembrane domain-containing protein [Bryobacteraceae bacterium]